MITSHLRARARVSGKVFVLAAGLALAGTWGSAAHAHGGVAEIHINDATPGDGSVGYEVHATWEDGDSIEDAQVTATPTGPSGEQQTPVPMEHTTGGVYAGTVETPDPGAWTVQFTLLHPDAGEPATESDTVEVAAQPTTTEAPTTTTAAPEADAAEVEEAVASEQAQADSGNSDVSLILVAVVFLVVGAVVGSLFWAVVGGRKDDDLEQGLDDPRESQRQSVGAR